MTGMSLSRPCGTAILAAVFLASLAAPIFAQSAPIVREFGDSPADARLRHSGRQGGRNAPEYFGRELATGDFNNDGRQDLAVSADFDTAVGDTSAGRGFVYVYFGRGSAPESDVDFAEREADCRIYGEKFFGQFGTELAVADFDGDGYDDIAASQIESLTTNWGNVYIVSGAAMATNAELRVADGDYITHIFGRRVGSQNGINLLFGFGLAAGDFNGDGVGDLAVAALGGDGVSGDRRESGEVSVWLGRRAWPREITSEPVNSDLFIEGRAAYVRMGSEIGAGDLDGDGLDEIAVATYGSNGPDDLRSFAGDVSIYSFGAASQVSLPAAPGALPLGLIWDTAYRQPSSIVHGSITGARIGTSASDGGGRGIAFGDFDGDGVDDMLLGAPFYGPSSPVATNPGAIFVVWGGETLLTSSVVDLASPGDAAIHLATGEAGISLGDTVHLADLNGDGRADAIAGAPDANEEAGLVAIYSGRPRPASTSGPVAPQPDAIVRGNTPLWRFGESAIALDASYGGSTILAIGTSQGGFFPFGGRGYAGEVDLMLAAPLTSSFPSFPAIAVTGATVVAPGASSTLQIEVDSPSGAAVALSAPSLPSFAQLRVVDASAGLYQLLLAPSAADRGSYRVDLVALDATGAESRQRLSIAVGYQPQIFGAKLKHLVGSSYKLTIDGTNISTGDARIVVDGTEIGNVKYPSKFAENGGATVRRITAKSSLISIVVEPNQTSYIRIVNPRENLASAPFAISR
jgi:hypothetical protein